MRPSERRARLDRAHLYLCTAVRDEAFLDSVLAAGVDIVQLRDKDAGDDQILEAARVFRAACDRRGALFIVNDRPDLARAVDADGVHVGQDDASPAEARVILGEDALVGRSTHSEHEIAAALAEPVDYLGVGPVEPTPTKPGRAGVGLELVEHAARTVRMPWFVTGGMNEHMIGRARAAGASRFVVVRAITEAGDPADAVRRIRRAIDASERSDRAKPD